MIVVFESPYSQYPSKATPLQNLAQQDINGYDRERFAYMISGAPPNWAYDQLSEFVNNIKSGAQYLFVTDFNIDQADVYTAFGSYWEDFVTIISTSSAESINTKP